MMRDACIERKFPKRRAYQSKTQLREWQIGVRWPLFIPMNTMYTVRMAGHIAVNCYSPDILLPNTVQQWPRLNVKWNHDAQVTVARRLYVPNCDLTPGFLPVRDNGDILFRHLLKHRGISLKSPLLNRLVVSWVRSMRPSKFRTRVAFDKVACEWFADRHRISHGKLDECDAL